MAAAANRAWVLLSESKSLRSSGIFVPRKDLHGEVFSETKSLTDSQSTSGNEPIDDHGNGESALSFQEIGFTRLVITVTHLYLQVNYESIASSRINQIHEGPNASGSGAFEYGVLDLRVDFRLNKLNMVLIKEPLINVKDLLFEEWTEKVSQLFGSDPA